MKALVFGSNGQDGFYLDQICTRQAIDTVKVSRTAGKCIAGNVANLKFVEDIIRRETPKYIFHLAANSSTSHSALAENHETIGTGTINILESCKKYSPTTKIFLSGSALQFKNDGAPINEDFAFEGNNPYSIIRNYSVEIGRYYRKLGLPVFIGYFFHHDSPLRSEKHINVKIARSAIENSKGYNQKLIIGNPEIIKEFNFAGDLMEAVWVLVNQNEKYEAVIGSGVGHKIQTWIDICFDLVGLKAVDYVEISDNYKTEFMSLVSDPKTIMQLGWEPKEDIYSLAMMMMQI